MKCVKRGLVYQPNKTVWWQQHYCILPTPYLLEDRGLIRVYFATTCIDKFGRLTYVDVLSTNPGELRFQSDTYLLDVGVDGAFDDCGVNPSSVIEHNNLLYLYYAGYQRHVRTPYSIFSGLATSVDGAIFKRLSNTPVLERTNDELSLRSAPTVIKRDGKFYMVYVSDFGWSAIEGDLFKGKRMPRYCLRAAESDNGIDWNVVGDPVLIPVDDEFGFGRPFLFLRGEIYYLFYSIRRRSISYRVGYAVSHDYCKTWQRKDDIVGLDVSDEGWDSEMICYAAPLAVGDKTYLFYNGNNNGETGFGYAEIVDFE